MDYRKSIRELFETALDAVLPGTIMRNAVSIENHLVKIRDEVYDLRHYRRVFVFGSGKASIEMAKSISALLGERIKGGLVICNYAAPAIGQIDVIKSDHPIPTQDSLDAAERLLTAFSQLQQDDLFIYLLSGGSSSLLEKPIPPITLSEFQSVSALMLRSGMPINELNVIRKHMSMIKGGRLGRSTRATGVVLVLSDVIGDDLTSIGSGPLYYDDSTYRDAERILHKYIANDALPNSVSQIIEKGKNGQIEDTPKLPPQHIKHYIVGNNHLALTAAKAAAEKLGLSSHILTSQLQGEAREAGRFIVSLGKEILSSGNPWSYPVVLIFGGETTVTVRGNGQGGRSQELALSVLREIGLNPHFTFLSAGFDGIDGQSDAAGALVDCRSHETSKELGLNSDAYLLNNDSYGFFKLTNDLIVTGPTGTNVGDIAILIVH